MKNVTRIFAIAIIMLGFASSSFAQETASASASATIVTPIAIEKNADMNFGNVAVQSTTGGLVVLSTAGERSTPEDGVTLPSTAAGTVSAASFSITGHQNYSYVITLPATCTITHNEGVATMTVDNFISLPSVTGLLSDGAQTLTVGATLNVAGGQLAGVYTSGTNFDVVVNYN